MVSDEVRKKIASLSPTEKEVLELVCEELKYKDIGNKLHMSESSVKNHMTAVRLKFGIDHLSRRKSFIELHNTYCTALKEIRDQSDKIKAVEKEPKREPKPKTQVKEKVPVVKPEIEKEKEEDKEKEKQNKDVFEKVEKNDDEKPPFVKQKKPLDEKKDIKQIKTYGQSKNDRFRSLKTIWRVISIAAIIFSGYMIYNHFFGTPPTQPSPSSGEPGQGQEEITIADTEVLPTDEIQPTAIPTETVFVPSITPSLLPTSQPEPATLFADNFDAGLSPAWQIVSGNPIVVNGMLSADQDTWIFIGDPSWVNYSVEFDADVEGKWYHLGANVLAVRVVDIDNMYAYKWADLESYWYVVENGKWNEVPQSDFTPGYGMFEFRITVVGDLLTIYVDGINKSSFFGTKFPQGKIGLMISAGSLIDNFIVKEIED